MYPEDEDEDFDFSEDLETAPEPEFLQVGRGRNRDNPFRVLEGCLRVCRRGRFPNNREQLRCENNCRFDFDQNVQQCVRRCNNNSRFNRQQRRNCRNECRNGPNNGNNNPPPRPPPPPSFTGNRSPRVVRNGQRFRFNLRGENEQCVDRHGQLYQWGQFNQVRSFGDCATACVNFVPSNLVFNNSFRGIEYIRGRNQCRCLYDRGFLNRSVRRLPGRFNRANTNERGVGSIDRNRGRFNRNYFCGTLAGAEDEE